ncbi:hypothetical protein E2562_036423 [Oryza meyeriana var. granulata]|uniref:Pectinesterase inhibitor domain-containing protein n=1 Tax=Oryza meyeriana var. granulata TaxID=110450 RepID=A0A6G1BQL4_9ORYZ|nr:hypothetical protein E2562_036423 [Oryza meyeriana var. granulata]
MAAAASAFASSSVRAVVVILSVVLLAAVVHASGGEGGGGGGRAAWTALDGVCGDLGGYYVTPELCKSALCGGGVGPSSSSPCRAARGAPEVAALAARLAAANATVTKASIEVAANVTGLQQNRSGNGTAAAARRQGMRSCLQLYADAVPALEWAARSVAAGRYRGAREVLQAAQYVSLGCEGMAGGGEGGGAAALPRENERFSVMAIVAHAVVASMLGP